MCFCINFKIGLLPTVLLEKNIQEKDKMVVVAVVVDSVSSRKVSLSRDINVLESVLVKSGRKVRLVAQ